MTLRNGGPAYPGVTVNDTDANLTDPFGTLLPPNGQATYSGMTLRDAFALAALQGALPMLDAFSKELQRKGSGADLDSFMAALSYRLADAMLVERAK